MADLSKLSDSDLRLLQKGQLNMMSVEGLRLIASAAEGDKAGSKRAWMNEPAPSAKQVLDEMSGPERFLAGMGKRFSDIGTLGLRKESAAEKDLMNDGAAMAGGIVGDLATMLGGGAALKGVQGASKAAQVARAIGQNLVAPQTAAKAAAAGGAWGALTDAGGLEDRLASGTLGALGGVVVPAATAVAKGAKALVDPLTKKGQERIAGRTLQRFLGNNVDEGVAAMKNPVVLVPGSAPNAVEATDNAGLAALYSGLQTVDPAFKQDATERAIQNIAARRSALQGIAGDADTLAAAKDSRNSAAQALYKQAFESDKMRRDIAKESVAALDSMKLSGAAPQMDFPTDGLRDLASRPVFKAALADAQQSMLNQGIKDVPINSVQGLHLTKLVIDEALNGRAPNSAIAAFDKSTLQAIKNQLVKEIEAISPLYGNARKTFADMSKPINQMEVGQAFYNKVAPALSDQGAAMGQRAASYAEALRNADKTAANATGFRAARLADVMTPEQVQTLQAVGKDLARESDALAKMRGIGPNTAQNLGTANLLRQAFGPLGLPQSFIESAFMQTLAKPISAVYSGIGEAGITNALGRGLLDPQTGAALVEAAMQQPKGLLGVTLKGLPYLSPFGTSLAIQQQ